MILGRVNSVKILCRRITFSILLLTELHETWARSLVSLLTSYKPLSQVMSSSDITVIFNNTVVIS